ncbi:MAG: hypothetical protein U0573_06370 [Phycisphaerales bacterium]|nr:hypothetical protein [Planctomycetota bacterium]
MKQTNPVRQIANLARAAARARRRGSFIVLVVGTLAMLSIIMIVYVAVGNADKRISSAISRRDRTDDVVTAFRDYAAQIIADDSVVRLPDPSNLDGTGAAANVQGGDLYMREAWDAPFTSWIADSTKAPSTTIQTDIPRVFRPFGIGDDPWLASTTPVWINFNPGAITTAPKGADKTFRDRCDWLHITNIAPDGRFVNLFNLRDNFDAAPGTATGQLNADLSLTKHDGTASNLTPPWGAGGVALTVDNPALFDSWQAGAFRPARGPFGQLTPNDKTYPPYQWADADGDGFLDSRWFEMTDARGQSGANPQTYRSLLGADPSFRWFFAARIVDLSALINVNTAGDQKFNANVEFAGSTPVKLSDNSTGKPIDPVRKADVIGCSPSDVDLRKLLLMADFEETVNNDTTAGQVQIDDANSLGVSVAGRKYFGGYSNFKQPSATGPVMQDYTKYVPNLAAATLQPIAGYTSITDPGLQLGEGAYRALRGGLAAGTMPGRFANFSADPLKTQAVTFATIRDRQDFYNEIGGLADRPVFDETTSKFNFGTRIRVDSLVELLTYRGVNDPSTTSSLEMAMGARFPSTFATTPKVPGPGEDAPIPYSPLRDNRSLDLEREGLSIIDGSATSGRATDAAMLKSYADVRQYLTTHSGARPIIPALDVTTTTPPNLDFPTDLNASTDLAIYVGNTTSSPLSAANLFKGYAAALAPGLGIQQAWHQPDAGSVARSVRGLFYGHQGPVTALLAAAHMTANFVAGAQSPSSTTPSHLPFTLVFDENKYTYQQANSLPTQTLQSTDWKKYFPSWWTAPSYRLNLGRDPKSDETRDPNTPPKLATVSGTDKFPVPAVNVYGMGDLHPFLVDVATFTVFRDTNASGIVSGAPQPDTEGLGYAPGQARPPEITINGHIDDPDNPDFMFRAIAFKLHNPYSYSIPLTSSFTKEMHATTGGSQFTPNTQLSEMMYVRVGTGTNAKFYVLVEAEEEVSSNHFTGNYTVKPVVMLPGETIVFYALNQDSQTIVKKKLGPSNTAYSFSDPENSLALTNWLDKQLGPKSGSSFRRVQALRVDDVKFADTNALTPAPATFASPTSGGVLVPAADAGDQDQTVMLWQAVRADSGTINDSSTASANNVLNDRLCDRLRLGSAINLDWRMYGKKADYKVFSPFMTLYGLLANPGRTDTPGGPDLITKWSYSTASGTVQYQESYQSRVTICFSVHAGRPGEAGGTLLPGQIPAWAIDPKDTDPITWYEPEYVPAPPGSDQTTAPALSRTPWQHFSKSDIDAGKAKPRFSGWTPQRWEALPAIYEFLPVKAEANTRPIPKNTQGEELKDIRREIGANRNGYRGFTSGTLEPDLVSQLRPSDLLNVMAIGSTQAPVDATGSPISDLNKQWTTTAEALAIGLGYSSKPPNRDDWTNISSKFGPLDYYYFDTISTAAPVPSLFDSGYLKTDDFVPVRFETGSDTKAYTAGTGVPFAANVLSMFTIRPQTGGSTTIATPGLININTAPQAVLRTLPFTFPSKDPLTQKVLWPDAGSSFDQDTEAKKSDIAATIEAYRDKIAVELRPTAKNVNPAIQTWFAGFFDREAKPLYQKDAQLPPNNNHRNPYPTALTQETGGRYWSTGIPFIREEPGFRSVGELLAARNVSVDTTGKIVAGSTLHPSNIDFMGYRDPANPTNMLGTDNIVEQELDATDPQKPTFKDIKPLRFGRTYQDKLKVLSGLLGSVSVRSDTYAVWFVVRGYQRSDCEGLLDKQPMVPTIERRFLMILDRSNVTKIGQKPRILAFVEVPL